MALLLALAWDSAQVWAVISGIGMVVGLGMSGVRWLLLTPEQDASRG